MTTITTQVSGIVNYLLAPTETNKKYVDGWTTNWASNYIRCYEMDVTCDSTNPAIPAKLTPGWR